MVAKLTRLTHIIEIQLHLVAESCTICSSYSRWPVQKLVDTPSYVPYVSPLVTTSIICFLACFNLFNKLFSTDVKF
jgi:hypothetical protein